MEYGKAIPIVHGLIEQLRPYCERIEVAGSLRRGKGYVKDAEIVAIAKLLELIDLGGSVVSIDAIGCQRHIAQRSRPQRRPMPFPIIRQEFAFEARHVHAYGTLRFAGAAFQAEVQDPKYALVPES